MSKRISFTIKMAGFIKEMADNGEMPLLDYVKRSPEEQKRLFDAGKSKCDGVNKISAHQKGLAADIYFYDKDNNLDFDKGRYYKWHTIWELKYKGKAMIDWDLPHFEDI